MSNPVPADRRHQLALIAAILIALLPDLVAPVWAATEADDSALAKPVADLRSSEPVRYVMLIARVFVNTVNKGDIPILRDAQGQVLVPAAEFAKWGLAFAGAAPVMADGERYIAVSRIEGLEARFDPTKVTLNLQVAANALPATTVNLGPQHRAGVTYPTDSSFFLNYGLNASGDDAFAQRRYQMATELAARTGNWLFYNTTNDEWGYGAGSQFTRLLTNVQYDDRENLRRLTLGDFFTPTFDLSSSVPLGGVSLTKFYSMDPYFIQYPTAAFKTEVALPSTVQVRVDGNLIAQRQVQPGPLDITNITGVTGGQNVSVVIRDPFGREQVLQQPFFFATNAGLAEGLHEYSYNLGFLRREYGIDSANYADLAAAAFHRYALTNQVTLGLRGQATQDLYNIGTFGTYQLPKFGIIGASVSMGGHNGSSGPASSLAYSYTGGNFSLNLGAQYLARDFAQLSDLESGLRVRSNQYASASVYFSQLGSFTGTYSAITSYDGPQSKIWNASYTRGMLNGKGLLGLNYTRTLEPQSTYTWLLSFRYFFDTTTSIVAGIGGSHNGNTQALSVEKSIPQGEGVAYTFTGGRAAGDGPDAMYGRAFVQANAQHATFGGEYSRASRPAGGLGLSQLFFAGSIGAVGGSLFVARPVDDSFALIRVPELAQVPVYANGWYVGKTDAAGEVVATNLASYYDNFITFGANEIPLDYVFPSSEKVISPSTRSGTLVAFAIQKNHAVYGVLVESRDGKRLPLEFREIKLIRGDAVIPGFTARRGEFYFEGVQPGEYQLQLDADSACAASINVPDPAGAMTDVGTVACTAVRR
jgi:outer membrane usher protein